MPFLRFKGFQKNDVKELSPLLIERFADIANVPQEIIKIELLNIEQITDTPCSVEIFMFQREQKRHDAISSMIYKIVSEYGYENSHIFFVILTPSLYYKEGLPLKEIPRRI